MQQQLRVVMKTFTEDKQENQFEKIDAAVGALTQLWENSNETEKVYFTTVLDNFISNKW